MQDCASGQPAEHDQSSHVNAQVIMMQSAVSSLVNALHMEWYNSIPQDLATRLRRPLLVQVSIYLMHNLQPVERTRECVPLNAQQWCKI